MRKTLAIFDKEFKSFFYSPLAYVVIAIFTALTGIFFYLYLSSFVEASFMDQIRAQQYRQMPQKFNVNLMLFILPFSGFLKSFPETLFDFFNVFNEIV